MKTISLAESFSRLEQAAAVIVDDTVLTYPGLSDLDGEDTNEFLCVNWTDEDGWDYSIVANEADNREVIVNDVGQLVFMGGDDQAFTVTLLTNWKL